MYDPRDPETIPQALDPGGTTRLLVPAGPLLFREASSLDWAIGPERARRLDPAPSRGGEQEVVIRPARRVEVRVRPPEVGHMLLHAGVVPTRSYALPTVWVPLDREGRGILDVPDWGEGTLLYVAVEDPSSFFAAVIHDEALPNDASRLDVSPRVGELVLRAGKERLTGLLDLADPRVSVPPGEERRALLRAGTWVPLASFPGSLTEPIEIRADETTTVTGE